MRFRVEYDYQRPGWDEFCYVRHDSIIVEASSKEEAMKKVEDECKYRVAQSATLIPTPIKKETSNDLQNHL